MANLPDDVRCSECEYYLQGIGVPDECRRYAPRPGIGVTKWPSIHPQEWCGEWVKATNNKGKNQGGGKGKGKGKGGGGGGQ